MRHLAETIADDARDPGEGPPGDGGWPWSAIPVTGCYRRGKWIDGLTERTGMTRRTISRTLLTWRGPGTRCARSWVAARTAGCSPRPATA